MIHSAGCTNNRFSNHNSQRSSLCMIKTPKIISQKYCSKNQSIHKQLSLFLNPIAKKETSSRSYKTTNRFCKKVRVWVKIRNPSNHNKYRKIRIMMKKRNSRFKFRENPSGNQYVLGSPNQSKMTILIIRNQFKVFRQNNHWKKPKLFRQI